MKNSENGKDGYPYFKKTYVLLKAVVSSQLSGNILLKAVEFSFTVVAMPIACRGAGCLLSTNYHSSEEMLVTMSLIVLSDFDRISST